MDSNNFAPAATGYGFRDEPPVVQSAMGVNNLPPPPPTQAVLRPNFSEYQPGLPPPFTQPKPPPYSPAQHPQHPPHVQFPQQTNNCNVVVVQQQQEPVRALVFNVRRVGDHFYTLSIVMLFLSIKCGLVWLLCTIPAVALSASARDDDRCGDVESARKKGWAALALNLTAVFSWIATVIGVIIFVVVSTQRSYSSYDD